MKDFTLIIDWNKLQKGDFPEKQIKECDENMKITYERISAFEQKITLSSLIPDNEDINTICFEIGSLVGTIVTNRYKK